ncbi:MAG: hypothetical protein K5Q00_01925 [Gammaproteobacteria bacterium]|nr:hypothetical protein [Gammaproteobacteria bacterium]
MSFLPKPTPAVLPKTTDAKRIAIFYAVLLTGLAVAQLFSFEHFLQLLTTFGFPFGGQFANFLGAFIVAAEVFSLPFLLRMPLSTAFRWFSMLCGWVVAAAWFTISLWLVIADSPVANIGYLGTVIDLMPGWWAIFIAIALGILTIWASWGMWPGKGKK